MLDNNKIQYIGKIENSNNVVTVSYTHLTLPTSDLV